MVDIPRSEPRELTAGDRWQWTRHDLADYQAPTWTLTYALIKADKSITLTATADGTAHAIDVAAATTANYPPGLYRWQAYVTSGSVRHTIGQGEITVRANFAAATSGADFRSTAAQLLEKIEAALIAGNVLHGAYTLSTPGGSSRTFQFRDRRDMLLERDRLRAEVKNEQIADKLASGMGGARRLMVRL